MNKKCPRCGVEVKPVADWPDDWVFCPNCLNHVEEVQEEKYRVHPIRVGAIPPLSVEKRKPEMEDDEEDHPGYNPYLMEGY